jgi:hypothetical protein
MKYTKLIITVILSSILCQAFAEDLPQIVSNHSQAIAARKFIKERSVITREDLQEALRNLSRESTGDICKWLALASSYRHMYTREGCCLHT